MLKLLNIADEKKQQEKPYSRIKKKIKPQIKVR